MFEGGHDSISFTTITAKASHISWYTPPKWHITSYAFWCNCLFSWNWNPQISHDLKQESSLIPDSTSRKRKKHLPSIFTSFDSFDRFALDCTCLTEVWIPLLWPCGIVRPLFGLRELFLETLQLKHRKVSFDLVYFMCI